MKIATKRKRNFHPINHFIIILFFALIGCEAEPIVPELNQSDKGSTNNSFMFNQISFSDLSSDQDFNNAFGKVSSVRNKQTTALKHSNFTIDTTSIKKINYGNNITYTMFIKRSEFNENYFENLILKIDSLKNIEAYIVKYTLNSPLEYYSEHESFSIDAEPEITRITLENTDNLIIARITSISIYCTRCNGTLNNGCGGAWHIP